MAKLEMMIACMRASNQLLGIWKVTESGERGKIQQKWEIQPFKSLDEIGRDN